MKSLRRRVIAMAAIAGIVGAAVPAIADDGLGYNPYPPFWQGWYAGVHLGYGEVGPLDGFLGGAQIGKNWQSAQFVYGWEADVTLSDISHEESFHGVSVESSVDWMATARARLGFLPQPGFLVYGTAGFGLVSGSGSLSFPGEDTSFDDTETDFVYGLGIEGRLSGTSTLRVEYLGFSDTEIDVIRGALSFKLGGY